MRFGQADLAKNSSLVYLNVWSWGIIICHLCDVTFAHFQFVCLLLSFVKKNAVTKFTKLVGIKCQYKIK